MLARTGDMGRLTWRIGPAEAATAWGPCPAEGRAGGWCHRAWGKAMAISAEAAVHEALCWGELKPGFVGSTCPDLRIPAL